MSIADALSEVWLFSGVSKEHLEKLAAFTFSRDYKSGDMIVEEGRTGNGLYIIVSGQVEVVKALNTERATRLATLSKGEFFGEMALLGEFPRTATVRALTDVACVGVDRWLFLNQLGKDPQLAITMLQAMAGRLRTTDANLTR